MNFSNDLKLNNYVSGIIEEAATVVALKRKGISILHEMLFCR